MGPASPASIYSPPPKLCYPLDIPGLTFTPASPDPSLSSLSDYLDASPLYPSPSYPSSDPWNSATGTARTYVIDAPSSPTLSTEAAPEMSEKYGQHLARYATRSPTPPPPLLFTPPPTRSKRGSGCAIRCVFVVVLLAAALGLGVGFSQRSKASAADQGEVVPDGSGTEGPSVVIARSSEVNGVWSTTSVTAARKKDGAHKTQSAKSESATSTGGKPPASSAAPTSSGPPPASASSGDSSSGPASSSIAPPGGVNSIVGDKAKHGRRAWRPFGEARGLKMRRRAL